MTGGLYRIVSADERVRSGGPSITLIRLFTVAATDDEPFIAAWERARQILREQPGYLDSSLHGAIDSAASFRFIEIAHWASADAALAAPTTDTKGPAR